MFSSGLLRPQSSNHLLRNFRDFLSLEKKPETLQQELYQYILAKSSTKSNSLTKSFKHITLFRKGPLSYFTTEKADPDLLLPCVLASGVPVKNIKRITAQPKNITTSNWESFRIMTRGGAVIQKIKCRD